MWGWLSRCLPSPLSAWLAGINGGLPRRPPPTLASSLTATTTTLPRWAGLCGPRSRRCHTRPPARPDTPRSLLGLLAGTAHTGSTTRTYSTRIQPSPSEHIAKEPAIGAQQPQRCKHCLLLHHHSTRPMMQATTQSGSKRNMSQAAPRARQVKHAAKGPMESPTRALHAPPPAALPSHKADNASNHSIWLQAQMQGAAPRNRSTCSDDEERRRRP